MFILIDTYFIQFSVMENQLKYQYRVNKIKKRTTLPIIYNNHLNEILQKYNNGFAILHRRFQIRKKSGNSKHKTKPHFHL